MKRILAIAGVLVAASALMVFATGASDDGGTYRVRAIFMSAFSVIPGEDVKIAGVKVGKIESLDVTPDHKAAVVLRIDRPGFDDFRADAECTIRPQSLIGERFVECTPTQPRPENAQPAPKLRKIEKGPGKGQYLLPVSQTSKPVDLDLVNNTLRLPYRERLAIILNELGTGLAGRGGDLRQAVINANPALKETDEVLAILARPEPGARQPGPRQRHHPRSAGPRPGQGGRLRHAGQRRERGHGRALERSRGEHRQAAGLPARADADDGEPRRAGGPDDAGADRPRQGGAVDQPLHRGARALLGRRASRRCSRSAPPPTSGARR